MFRNLNSEFNTVIGYQEYVKLHYRDIINKLIMNEPYKKGKKYIAPVLVSFDIETSKIYVSGKPNAFMYIWMCGITNPENGQTLTIIGRKWSEFENLIKDFKTTAKNRMVVIYVHNLAYEYQFLKSILHFDDTFFQSTRKPLVLRTDNIEFRCSYILTNMSLAQFTSKYCKMYQKMTGDLDYNVVRYRDTKLTLTELRYCINDVVGLNEALINLMKSENDNLATIPLTSTGYVRRNIQNAIKNSNERIEHCQPLSPEVFKMLRLAFRGGNTHANRFHIGELLHDVHSVDRASAYPTEMVTRKFPVNFKRKSGLSPKRVENIMNCGKAVLLTFRYKDLRLKHNVTCPYLPTAKVFRHLNTLAENGRVLMSDEGEITVTDIDYQIIKNQYDFIITEIIDCYTATYKYLPDCVINVVKEYYNNKTTLKGIKEKEEYYMKAKNLLNALYGMTVYNPFKDEYEYNEATRLVERVENGGNLRTVLLRQAAKNNLNYAVGVWVTAYARYELQRMIDAVGEDFIYCDTDSVKFLGDHKDDVELYNIAHVEYLDDHRRLFATDPKGEDHWGGVYEYEGVYREFKTLGAKKYCYTYYNDDEIHLTCAGAPKYCAKELDSVDDFEPGFEFMKAGLSTIYNDSVLRTDIIHNGHVVELTTNTALIPRTYNVNLEPTLEEILRFLSTKYNDVKDGFSPNTSEGVFKLPYIV